MKKSIFALPLVALISACNISGTAPGPSVEEYLNTVNTEITTPGDLYEESEKNPVSFEKKYDRKYVLLTGWLDAIKKESVIVQSMYTMQSSTFGPTRQKGKVSCSIPTGERESVLTLKIGQKVLFGGKVKFNSESFMGNIYIKDCIVMPIKGPNFSASGLGLFAAIEQLQSQQQLTFIDMKELFRQQITGVSPKEPKSAETKQSDSRRNWSNENPDAVLERMKEMSKKEKLLAIRDLNSYESAKTEKFAKVKCDFAKGTRGEEKCLGKWVEGFGWHTLIFTEFIPPYDSKKYVIKHSQDNWEGDGTCFKYTPKESKGNDKKSRVGRKSNSKVKVQSTKIDYVCASRVPIAELKNVGGLWSRVDLENKSSN